MLNKSKTNSVRLGVFVFQPLEYDTNGNLQCVLYKIVNCQRIVILRGVYSFDDDEFLVTFVYDEWLTKRKNRRTLKKLLNGYDWCLDFEI